VFDEKEWRLAGTQNEEENKDAEHNIIATATAEINVFNLKTNGKRRSLAIRQM
jgi:hypothetical protein